MAGIILLFSATEDISSSLLLKNLKTICTEVNIQQVEDIFSVGKYFPMEKIKKPSHIGVHSSGT